MDNFVKLYVEIKGKFYFFQVIGAKNKKSRNNGGFCS